MTSDDRTHFGEALHALGEVFNEPVSAIRVKVYFDVLQDLEWADVRRAMREAATALKFFPKPVELRELAVGKTEDAAEEAWRVALEAARSVGVHRSPDLPPAVERTMKAVFGDWQAFCSAEVRGPEGLGWRKQFIAAYGACARREAVGVPYEALTHEEAKKALADLRARQRAKQLPPKVDA